jgi:hypothetical protein
MGVGRLLLLMMCLWSTSDACMLTHVYCYVTGDAAWVYCAEGLWAQPVTCSCKGIKAIISYVMVWLCTSCFTAMHAAVLHQIVYHNVAAWLPN